MTDLYRDSVGRLMLHDADVQRYIPLHNPNAPTGDGPFQPVQESEVTALDIAALIDGIPHWRGHAEDLEYRGDPDPVPEAAYMLHRRLTSVESVLVALSELDRQLDHTDPTATGDVWAARSNLVITLVRCAGAYPWLAGYRWDDDGPDGYRWVAFVHLPTGQVSWHLPEGWRVPYELETRPANRYPSVWDGHDRAEKAARIASYLAQAGGRA